MGLEERYPAEYFVGSPRWLKKAVDEAITLTGVRPAKWRAPLTVISRYESDNTVGPPPGVCADCRGLVQCSVGMYKAAHRQKLIGRVDYEDPVQAMVVAIHYVNSNLVGYGGYQGITRLVARHDRGPGDVLRAWIAAPASTYAAMRRFYHGY